MNRNPLEELWTRMLAIYGHRWESNYGRVPTGIAGDTWAAGLSALDPRALGRGLDACLRSGDGWPPSLPEFLAMCRGIPSFAFVQADLRAEDRHPFTRIVWSELDAFGFKRASADQAGRLLREAYERARERVMRGEALPDEPVQIAPDPDMERRQREKELDEHDRRLGLGKYAVSIDMKRLQAGPDA